jgi:hypothetical protein
MEEYVVYNSNYSLISTPVYPLLKDVLFSIIPNDLILLISFFLPRNIKYKIYNIKYKPNRKQKYYIREKINTKYR